MDSGRQLIYKLNQFIRKYYVNKIIRGSILFGGLLVVLYLITILLEYFFQFGSITRTIFFYGFLGIFFLTFVFWVGLPVMKLFHLGRRLTREQAAIIIGTHFPEIEDKLLNALQLLQQMRPDKTTNELLTASIDQKIGKLRIFNFKQAINLKSNWRYARFVVVPLGIMMLMILFTPKLISDSTNRLVQYDITFQAPPPFVMSVLNEDLNAFQHEDFKVFVRVDGEIIPEAVHIIVHGNPYRMRKDSLRYYSYTFNAIQEDVDFLLLGGAVKSEMYHINVFPKPTILEFTVELNFPAYIRKPNETLENTGDLTIPQGTEVTWRIYTRDVDSLIMKIGLDPVQVQENGGNRYTVSALVMQSESYWIHATNHFMDATDTLKYRILSIPDGYPSIQLFEDPDTVQGTVLFAQGEIMDDYGFDRMEFHYKILDENLDPVVEDVRNIPVDDEVVQTFFFDRIELQTLNLMPGQRLQYHYEIWDNDAISGPKSAKTEVKELKTRSIEEIESDADREEEKVKEQLDESLEEVRDIERGIEEMSKLLIEKDHLTWQEKEQIKSLLKRNEKILENLEKIREKNQENIERQEEYLKASPQILEKQKRLNELLEEVMTEEMKEKMDELRALMDQLDKDKLAEIMEQMKMTSEELEEQLDRNLELFKQIEFSRNLEKQIKELEELARKEKSLADSLKRKEDPTNGQKMEQQEIRQAYDSIKKELQNLSEMEKELDMEVGIQKTKPLQDSISSQLEKIDQEMQGEKQKSNGEKQRRTGEDMEQLAQQLQAMQQAAEEEQIGEDIRQIRQILQNLLEISFDQERLMGETRKISHDDPRYQEIIVNQREMSDKLQSARDSLEAIGKRQFMIQPIISREIRNINENIDQTIQNLNERNVALALAKQQYTMGSINRLAILLNEAMEQMNEQMSQSKQGKSSKMCQNPSSGKGKQSMKNLKKMQESLSQQLEELKKGMEEQMKNQGEKKGEEGQKGMNERIARLAAQQEAIRKEMQQYQEQLKEQGYGNHGEQEAVEEMDRLEDDLIHKRINQQTLLRQQKILTRMLESEKAEQKREQEERRESNESKNQKFGNPGIEFEYNTNTDGQMDILRYERLPVNQYYKQKANRYMIGIIKQNNQEKNLPE